MTTLKVPPFWSFVIFFVEGKANHCGLHVPGRGLADLSLRGARIIPWDAPSLPKGDVRFYAAPIPDPRAALEFLSGPGLLMPQIIARERRGRGWHLTKDAPDYVRTFHTTRSRDPDDMNCVEWIVYAAELGGLKLPDDVLTPTELDQWCSSNLTPFVEI